MKNPSFKTESEEFVFKACKGTFLSLWSYANPLNDDGTELCDALIVCDPHVVVISVKEINLSEAAAPDVAADRWLRKAVKESVAQLYGAARWLRGPGARVIRHDGAEGIPLPPVERRKTHLISVSLGAEGIVPVPVGDFGKGYVHVLGRGDFRLLLGELDTVTDLVEYLEAKESLADGRNPLRAYEKDLLAIYLHHGRRFPAELDYSEVDDSLWDRFIANDGYRRKQTADRVSYAWDRITDYFAQLALEGQFEFGKELSENEITWRTMARERRFSRRCLAESIIEFHDLASKRKVRARVAKSESGVGYVFMNARPTDSREYRVAELRERCLIARKDTGCKTIVGICSNAEAAPRGHCEDIAYLFIESWTEEMDKHVEEVRAKLGFFASPTESTKHFDEYPDD